MITYVKGDATRPSGTGPKILVHCVNDLGAWGAGFVLAISKRWPEPEEAYVGSLVSGPPKLGAVQFVQVSPNIVVANLVGQRGLIGPSNPSPVRYEAIRQGLEKVSKQAKKMGASLHMPRMGCGLAGGKWEKVEPLINETCGDLEVTVYDL